MLDVAEPLLGGLGERHVGLEQAGEGAAPGFIEHRPQPVFRRALGEVPGRRPASLGPRRADLLLYLPSVRKPVLGEPLMFPLSQFCACAQDGDLEGF